MDDNKWEPDEEFFLRLTIVGKRNEKVKLGRYPIMEITIIDNEGYTYYFMSSLLMFLPNFLNFSLNTYSIII